MSEEVRTKSALTGSRLLYVGAADAVFECLTALLSEQVASVDRSSWAEAAGMPEGTLRANLLLLAPPMPPSRAVDDIGVADLMEVLDEAFIVSARLVRQLAANPHPLRRVVFHVGWSVHGLSLDGVAALVAGGTTGLVRSWASELDAAGVTANVVVVGNADEPGIVEGTAHATKMFLAPEAASISGQVLSVAGSWSTGTLPV